MTNYASLSTPYTLFLLETPEGMELENRLGLYQVFLKLYEHNRSLLDEILQLENSNLPSACSKAPLYVQGVVQGQQAYLITNLVNGQTQRLHQPQKIWIIGRDRRIALCLRDQWMSRRHAAIQYVTNEGFYLIDLNSTNGSFVNGEPVYQRVLLNDGDLIRLGSVAISFFVGQTSRNLEPLSPDLLAQINQITNRVSLSTTGQEVTSLEEGSIANRPDDSFLEMRQKPGLEGPTSPTSLTSLSASERSEILDRFLSNRQSSVGQN
ncbi:MAG TPA: FHA domain-containing protein [Leptolyngbyaceae cyanobacterium]